VPAHAVATAEEARAEDVVGTAARYGLEDAIEVRGVVLAVAVEVDGGGVALLAGDLETRSERCPQPARGGMGMDPRTKPARYLGSGVARAVVDEKQIDGHPAGLARNPREDAADGGLLVASHHDREAAAKARLSRSPHRWVLLRYQRATAGGQRGGQAEQARDRRRELEHRAGLA
jgi:hypothetical protein